MSHAPFSACASRRGCKRTKLASQRGQFEEVESFVLKLLFELTDVSAP